MQEEEQRLVRCTFLLSFLLIKTDYNESVSFVSKYSVFIVLLKQPRDKIIGFFIFRLYLQLNKKWESNLQQNFE